jgi:hypothetical protein
MSNWAVALAAPVYVDICNFGVYTLGNLLADPPTRIEFNCPAEMTNDKIEIRYERTISLSRIPQSIPQSD